MTRTRDVLLKTLPFLGIALGGWLLWHSFRDSSPAQIAASLQTVSGWDILRCLVCAAGSYFCLTINDWLGLRHVGHPLRYRYAALASFVSLALGHNIGFSGLSSGVIRYRFYSRWGLGVADVAHLTVFCGLTVAMGLLGLATLVLLLTPQMVSSPLGLSVTLSRLLGLAAGALIAAYLLLSLARPRVTLRGWTFALPKPGVALTQLAVGTVNFSLVAACLEAALGGAIQTSFAQVAAAYLVGNVTAIVAHVPGGLGVIEYSVISLVPHGAENLSGPLLQFRAVYYLLPLILGLIAFSVTESVFRLANTGKADRVQGQRKG